MLYDVVYSKYKRPCCCSSYIYQLLQQSFRKISPASKRVKDQNSTATSLISIQNSTGAHLGMKMGYNEGKLYALCSCSFSFLNTHTHNHNHPYSLEDWMEGREKVHHYHYQQHCFNFSSSLALILQSLFVFLRTGNWLYHK
jgi:hypothetical protein